jgi:hypothetical protein
MGHEVVLHKLSRTKEQGLVAILSSRQSLGTPKDNF